MDSHPFVIRAYPLTTGRPYLIVIDSSFKRILFAPFYPLHYYIFNLSNLSNTKY